MFLLIAITQVCFAGQLVQNGEHFSYYQDDGTFAFSKWINMDIDADGVNESYCFNEQGNINHSNNTNSSEEMVWIVETGKKFHKNKSCSGMNNPNI